MRGSLERLFADLVTRPGMVGAHLLRGDPAASRTETGEKALRGAPDEVADWVALVEAIEPDALAGLRLAELSDVALTETGATDLAAGVYSLQCALAEEELKPRD